MSKLDELLRQTAEETFESLAYMFTLAPDEDAPADPPMVSAAVTFSGPFGGILLLSIEQAMLTDLAGNMLGIMDAGDLTAAQETDGFGELLNVVCGNLLPRLAGEEAVFDVHAPRLLCRADLPAALAGLEPRGSAVLELDGGRATICLYADADVEAAAAATG